MNPRIPSFSQILRSESGQEFFNTTLFYAQYQNLQRKKKCANFDTDMTVVTIKKNPFE